MQSKEIISAIQKVVTSPAVLHEPLFSKNESKYVLDSIESGIVSSIGPYVDKLELQLAEKLEVNHVILTVNGTAALHTCLLLAGVVPNDEVLIPALTFVATANAVNYCQAIPHLIESSDLTLGICPLSLSLYLEQIIEMKTDGHAWNKKTGRRVSVCVPMHTFGHPVDLEPLITCCERFNIKIVEDAAESLGSYYKGKPTGSYGLLSAISFNGNKILTTGGGGAIATNNSELALRAKHITTTAKIPHPCQYVHDQIGFNYRMPNLNAALGCAQLERLDEFVKIKRELTQLYVNAFLNISEVKIFLEPINCRSNYWLNLLVLKEEHSNLRNEILSETHKLGIFTRPAWELMSELPMYKACPRMELTQARALSHRIICLPSSVKLVGNPN